MIVIEQPREVGQPRRKVWCNKTDLTAQGVGYVFNDLPQDVLGFGSIVFVVDEPGLVLWYDSENGEMYERVLGGASIALETLSVTANDSYTAPEGTAYNIVNVNVPNTYTSSDEGKVVQNGALVNQSSRIVTNIGTYNTITNNQVIVTIPIYNGAYNYKEWEA